MVTLRELTTMPDMPTWVRIILVVGGVAMIIAAFAFAQPLLDGGWAWRRGLFVLVAGAIGVDLVLAGSTKRWPWLMHLVPIGSA